MDPHFPEYLAAIAGMHDVYGEPTDDRPSDFHEVSPPATPATTAVVSVVREKSQWAYEPSEDFTTVGSWI